MVNGSLPEEIIGYLFKPISIAFMHAAPSAKVPELAADLRRLGAYVAIIVVESGERLNQQLSTCELRQAMTAQPTAKELSSGFNGYLTCGGMFVRPPGFAEASFPILFVGT